jgi:hypothetical protein
MNCGLMDIFQAGTHLKCWIIGTFEHLKVMNKKFAFTVGPKGQKRMVIRMADKYSDATIVSANFLVGIVLKTKICGGNTAMGNRPMSSFHKSMMYVQRPLNAGWIRY